LHTLKHIFAATKTIDMSNCSCNGNCHTEKKQPEKRHPFNKYIPVSISFVLLFTGIILNNSGQSWFTGPSWVNPLWFIAAYLPVGLPVLKESLESLREKEFFNEFMLMSIATIGAFYIGEYPEGVAVMLFYAVGELFQNSAVDKAKRNISDLLDVRPETAEVIKDGKIESISPEAVRTGDIIEVKVGGRVPLDGTMENEKASFNTAALTGESVPKVIRRGEDVLAGMIVTDNVTRIKVSKIFSQSALSRILELVEEATERKAPAEQFIRKFAKIYTPIAVGLAFLIVLLPLLYSLITSFEYMFDDWLYRGLVFLVISCPCALVISIPLGYFGGIGLASKNGILFKGSNYLEEITKINTVVMDKTGTLTKGVFEVQKVVSNAIGENDLVGIIASVEAKSAHPIGKAITRYARSANLPVHEVSEVSEIPGHGLSAVSGGQKVLAGNAGLLKKFDIDYPSAINDIAETIVLCAIDNKYAGYILVADQPKEDASKAVSELKSAGIKNIVMLSGDKQAIVSKLAGELGIEQAYGDLMPEDKVRHVEELRKDNANKIVFVGDGVNDAPVLALSDVGIAMGGLGSDVAIETADVVIQTDQPAKIPLAIRIGSMTRQIIIQNISLAFGVKLIVLILGAGGVATLWEAVFADVGVALLAILNATRLLNNSPAVSDNSSL
jgi:Cd2+/Zn2+-exporting ATPase